MIRLTLGALTLAAAIALPATSRAQDATPPSTQQAKPAHHHHYAHALFRNVNVTKDERSQMRTIHEKYAPQIKAARQSGDRATIRTLRGQQLDEMRTVLTPEQQQTFDANRAALRARAKHATPPAAPAPSSATPPSSAAPAAASQTPAS